MTCRDTRALLHALLDGELDLVHQMEVEAHLKDCAGCARAYDGLRALGSRLGERELYFRAPASLRHRVEKIAASGVESGALPAFTSRLAWLRPGGWTLAVAAAAMILLVVGGAWIIQFRRAAGDVFAQEIVAAHIRSLLPGHLTDVMSSDQHNVKPWFAGRIDFSPPVPDLSARGFDLIGGRLDYAGARTVAVLVYKRRQHVLNVFVWPSSVDGARQAMTLNGYNILQWEVGSMRCLVVSDLNAAELRQFVELARQAMGG